MMKIRLAVEDYQRMFPDEYRDLLVQIEHQRQNLDTEMAEIKGTHVLKRGLFTVSETLSVMIGQKLDQEERVMFKELDHQRWFAKEFPQFSITKEV